MEAMPFWQYLGTPHRPCRTGLSGPAPSQISALSRLPCAAKYVSHSIVTSSSSSWQTHTNVLHAEAAHACLPSSAPLPFVLCDQPRGLQKNLRAFSEL